MKNQKGFAAVESLLIVVIIVLIAGVGYYVWNAQKQANATLDAASKSAQSSPAVTKKPTATAEKKYFTIKEWGIQAPYNGGLTLEYKVDSDSNTALGVARTSSAQLDASGIMCKENPEYGGIIARYLSTAPFLYEDGSKSGKTAAQFAQSTGLPYGKVDNYYYFYVSPQALCGDGQDSQDIQTQTQAAIKAIVPHLQAVPDL